MHRSGDVRQLLKQLGIFVRSARARLALSYLAIIMLMSVGFSVVFFNTSARELERRPQLSTGQNDSNNTRPHIEHDPAVEAYLEQRADEGRHVLLQRLLLLNLIALAGGGALSYYLARRTLRPIEENMDAQAQFVSDASHELRTPLTALQTTNEVALRKPKLSEAEARDLLGYNVAEVVKLKALTDGLLRLARQDNHSLTRSRLSLQDIASEAMNAIITPAQKKNIVIEDNVPDIQVLGDETGAVQSLVILLDNAVKYSPPGSTVRLTGGKHGKTGFISIADEGQGIAKHDMPHIFDRFYRADQSRSKQQTEGYGIGLSLAKKIIHQLDGEIIASSTEGKGSTFSVRLPLA